MVQVPDGFVYKLKKSFQRLEGLEETERRKARTIMFDHLCQKESGRPATANYKANHETEKSGDARDINN